MAVLPIVCGACLAPAQPTLATLAQQRKTGAVIAERERHRRELQIAEQETRDLIAAIAAAKAESVAAAAALRAVRAELQWQLERLHAAERELEAVDARLQQIDGEVAEPR